MPSAASVQQPSFLSGAPAGRSFNGMNPGMGASSGGGGGYGNPGYGGGGASNGGGYGASSNANAGGFNGGGYGQHGGGGFGAGGRGGGMARPFVDITNIPFDDMSKLSPQVVEWRKSHDITTAGNCPGADTHHCLIRHFCTPFLACKTFTDL